MSFGLISQKNDSCRFRDSLDSEAKIIKPRIKPLTVAPGTRFSGWILPLTSLMPPCSVMSPAQCAGQTNSYGCALYSVILNLAAYAGGTHPNCHPLTKILPARPRSRWSCDKSHLIGWAASTFERSLQIETGVCFQTTCFSCWCRNPKP